jgi:hypothetical protein
MSINIECLRLMLTRLFDFSIESENTWEENFLFTEIMFDKGYVTFIL